MLLALGKNWNTFPARAVQWEHGQLWSAESYFLFFRTASTNAGPASQEVTQCNLEIAHCPNQAFCLWA